MTGRAKRVLIASLVSAFLLGVGATVLVIWRPWSKKPGDPIASWPRPRHRDPVVQVKCPDGRTAEAVDPEEFVSRYSGSSALNVSRWQERLSTILGRSSPAAVERAKDATHILDERLKLLAQEQKATACEERGRELLARLLEYRDQDRARLADLDQQLNQITENGEPATRERAGQILGSQVTALTESAAGRLVPSSCPVGKRALLRYPVMQAPAVLRPDRPQTVRAFLDDKPPAGVSEKPAPSSCAVPEGQVKEEFDDENDEAWQVEVQLFAPDATITPAVQTVWMEAEGRSDEAAFRVKPTWKPGQPQEKRQLQLLAVFSRKGRIFARTLRTTWVTADPSFVPPDEAAPPVVQSGEVQTADLALPDLYVEVITITKPVSTDGENWRATDRIVAQAQLIKKDPVLVANTRPLVATGLDAFLAESYTRLAGLAPRGGALEESEDQKKARKMIAADALRQLGLDIWNRYTPDVLKTKLLALQRLKPEGADIRIQSNDPRIPFELLLVPRDGKSDCSKDTQATQCELLGVLHRVSRWHMGPALGISPDARTRQGAIAVIVPSYSDPLAGAAGESAAIKELAGSRYQQLAGSFIPLLAALGTDQRPAVLHYAGHGEANPGTLSGMERYQLRLEDRPLDLATFKQHVVWLDGDHGVGPLVFLNACDVGRSEGAYGFAEGWAPAVLEGGAAGFIGGLWPLGDAGASAFSRSFYGKALKGVPIAEALRAAREQYRTSGDPTFAAYVYYGHPDLRISAEMLGSR